VGRVGEIGIGPTYDFLGEPAHAAAFSQKQVEDQAAFNVTVGQEMAREYTFNNSSGAELAWRIDSPVPWVKAEPSSGKLKPYESSSITFKVSVATLAAGTHEQVVNLVEVGGQTLQALKFKVYAIPPYAPPALPTGEVAPLGSLPKTLIAGHKSRSFTCGTSDPKRPDFGPRFEDKTGNIVGSVPQETIYNLQGTGFSAFSAKVQLHPEHAKPYNKQNPNRMDLWQVNFEIYVDRQLRAQSGIMKAGDEPRLLAVTGLENAKEMRLLTRFDVSEPKYFGPMMQMLWLEPKFYKGK